MLIIIILLSERLCSLFTGCMAASSLTIQPETPYAVISIGGVKQYVEEGMSFFTPSSASFMVMDVALKGTVQFKTVLALKSDGTLVKGTRSKPYVTDALVEGELLEDEFRVMETRLKKIKVTKITRTSTAATLSNKAQ